MAVNQELYDRIMRVYSIIYPRLNTRNDRIGFFDAIFWAKHFSELPEWVQDMIWQAEADNRGENPQCATPTG